MTTFLLRPSDVRASLARLLARRIHPHFVGYLCVRYSTQQTGRAIVEPHEFKAFFDAFLDVPGGPSREAKPYYRPFSPARQPTLAHGWMNANIAGSFALSSQRDSHFVAVVEMVKKGYRLREKHATLALERLAYGNPIPALDLAVYLYRNYGFEARKEPRGANLLDVFKVDFGYVDKNEERDFHLLYDSTIPQVEPVFEATR